MDACYKNFFGVVLLSISFSLIMRLIPSDVKQIFVKKDELNVSDYFKNQPLQKILNTIMAARGENIILDFYADWCISCHEMESLILKSSTIRQELNKFIVLKVDITANSYNDKTIMKYFNIVAPPALLFFNKQGEEQSTIRIIGEISQIKFLQVLKSFD